MKAEDIDLDKEQVFETPIEGFEFSDVGKVWSKESLKAILLDKDECAIYTDMDLVRWRLCRPIQPKTRPMTHFEILKLDAVFKHGSRDIICNNWISSWGVEEYNYCLRSDFQKAETLEDVVWKKLEVEV